MLSRLAECGFITTTGSQWPLDPPSEGYDVTPLLQTCMLQSPAIIIGGTIHSGSWGGGVVVHPRQAEGPILFGVVPMPM